MLTVTIVPVLFAVISPSEEEFVMWESIVNFFLRTGSDPLDDPDAEDDDEPTEKGMLSKITETTAWWIAYGLYVCFSPYTCIVTQVQLHLTQTHAVGYYLEFSHRTKKGQETGLKLNFFKLLFSNRTIICGIIRSIRSERLQLAERTSNSSCPLCQVLRRLLQG